MVKPNLAYNEYQVGYGEDDNPWHWAANSVETENGESTQADSTTAPTCPPASA